MKKGFILLSVFVLLLTSCDVDLNKPTDANNTTEAEKTTEETEETDEAKTDATTEALTEATLETKVQETTTSFPDDLEYSDQEIIDSELYIEVNDDMAIYYNDRFRSIYLKLGDRRLDVADQMASEPELSPDGMLLAYLAPYEFEMQSGLSIYNLNFFGFERTIELMEDDDSMKYVSWVDDHRLFIVVGYTPGTISFGGDLYMYDLTDNTLKLIMEPVGNDQIISAHVVNNTVVVETLHWLDDILNEHEETEESYPLSDLLQNAVPATIGYMVN